MLERNREVHKRRTVFIRLVALLLPIMCVALLLTQTVFAKNTYLINDGGRVTIHTTYATDPAEVLNEAGLELGRDDTYTTQPGLTHSEITIQRKQEVTVIYDGKTMTVSSYGETVQELLDRIALELGEEDVVSEARNTCTYDGMTITISHVITLEESYTAAIPFETKYCYDPALKVGEERVVTEGVEGQMLYTDSVHYVDGAEISRTPLSETVVTQPVNALIALGSRVDLPNYSPDAPQWSQAPSEPKIGENFIVTTSGEVLSYSHTGQFVATAYHNSDPGCTIYTYIGTLCRVGAIAVDPSVIPLGTKMYIVTNDGQYIYGYAVAEDTGGAIKGNRVDLYFDTVEECYTFGIRDCTIYFLD